RAQGLIHPVARAIFNGDSALPRQLRPELLDQLPETDPGAIRSRRDLRRVNWHMGNAKKAAGAIQSEFAQSGPRKLVELGAGDGTFFLRVAQLLGPGWKG